MTGLTGAPEAESSDLRINQRQRNGQLSTSLYRCKFGHVVACVQLPLSTIEAIIIYRPSIMAYLLYSITFFVLVLGTGMYCLQPTSILCESCD